MTIRGRHRRRRRAGTALLEFLIAFVIATAAMAIAMELLQHAQRQSAFDSLEALEMPIPVALGQLRGDAYAAYRATDERGARRYPGLLRLEGGPAGPVEYELVGTDLVRRLDRGGERIVLSDVFEWTWNDVEESRRPQVLIAFTCKRSHRTTALRPGQAFETRHEWLLLTLRGGGSSSW